MKIKNRRMFLFFTSPRVWKEDDFRAKRGSRVRGHGDYTRTAMPLTRLASLASLSPQAGRGKKLARLAVIDRVRPHVGGAGEAVSLTAKSSMARWRLLRRATR